MRAVGRIGPLVARLRRPALARSAGSSDWTRGPFAGTGSRRFGQRRHLAVEPWSDYVEVHWSPLAEAYVTPVSAQLVGVAVLGAAGRSYDELLAQVPTLRGPAGRRGLGHSGARRRSAAAVGPAAGGWPGAARRRRGWLCRRAHR